MSSAPIASKFESKSPALRTGGGVGEKIGNAIHLLSARSVEPIKAGGLAHSNDHRVFENRFSNLQLRDSAGLLMRVTGFAIEPSHPGEEVP